MKTTHHCSANAQRLKISPKWQVSLNLVKLQGGRLEWSVYSDDTSSNPAESTIQTKHILNALFQINIDKEEVVYMQNDMAYSNDSFVATISNLEVNVRDLVFNIRVVPLVKRVEPFICETKTALTQKHLDTSQLAGLTNSNPIYFLVDPPKHGKIMRIVRPSGSRSKVGQK